MNKQELWAAYVAKNPSFEGDKPVTMSPAGLKKLFDQTWDMAESHALEGAPPPSNPFDQLFGGRR